MTIVGDEEGYRWWVRETVRVDGEVQDMIGVDVNHEIETLKFLRMIATPSMVFVDVGAHVGYFTVRLSKSYGKIIAVEPDPLNYEVLERNIKLNRLSNVEVLKVAASSVAEEKLLHQLGGRSTFLRHSECLGRVMVKTELLDNLVEKADVIKIDTEGHELEVLRGAPRLISQKPVIIVENHGELSEEFPHFKPIVGCFAMIKRLLVDFECVKLESSRYVFKPC